MTTTNKLNFAEYQKNLDSLERLSDDIDRLESFDELTQSQEEKLERLRSSYRVLDKARLSHERQCLVEGISRDGTQKLERHLGHTPKPLDDDLEE